jgi:A/G-specific adenine glycosylase
VLQRLSPKAQRFAAKQRCTLVDAVSSANTHANGDSMKAFQRAVLRFYRRHKRDLPWRRTRDPYRILVSEVMLQQTQVDRVIPKYRSFLARFPTLRALARARFADVLREWLGLGYNGRALRLWRCARAVVRESGGKLPSDVSQLERLPGIGAYTAAAVAAIAFGAHVPAVDVNVRRVLTRALSGRDDVAPPRVSLLAKAALPKSAASEWTQALMDIGSMHCKASPRCSDCPLRSSCAYVRARRSRSARAAGANGSRAHPNVFIGSSRFYRGRVMRVLATHKGVRVGALGREVKKGFNVTDGAWLQGILASLERDGLIRFDRTRKMVRLP